MDNQLRPKVANYRKKKIDEPTIEELKAAIKAERKKMSEVQKSIDNWTQIISDIETDLQVSQPTQSEWMTRYDNQRDYNQSTKQRTGSLKSQLQMVKNGQTPLPEEKTSNFTRTDYQHYVKTLMKEKQSLQSEYDSYSRQLDDTSREYHHLLDEIYSIVNDICYGQDSRIKLQEERDRKQGQQPRHHSQSTSKQWRKPRDSSHGNTVVQSNSRPQSHDRNRKNISALPKLPPIKKEASTVSSPGTSYVELYNQRKQSLQSNLPYQPPSANKSGPKSKTKKKKKNEENQKNNGNHGTLPSISPSVPQTKKTKVKRQDHFKLPNIFAEEHNSKTSMNGIVEVKNETLANPNWAPLQMECQPWIGNEVSMVVMDEGRPSNFGEKIVHQDDTPLYIVMEDVPPTVVGILKKVPKIYSENNVLKDMRKKGKSVTFRCAPEIFKYF